MKKIIIMTALTFSLGVTAMAHKGDDTHDGVVALPHLMKVIIKNSEKLEIDKKQQEQFDTIMKEIPALMHAMMHEAHDLEHAIQKDVMKNKKTNADVKVDLDKLQTLELKISTLQIDTINKLQNILSDEQYEKLMQTFKKKNKKSH